MAELEKQTYTGKSRIADIPIPASGLQPKS
jgi:hypothetical protein